MNLRRRLFLQTAVLFYLSNKLLQPQKSLFGNIFFLYGINCAATMKKQHVGFCPP